MPLWWLGGAHSDHLLTPPLPAPPPPPPDPSEIADGIARYLDTDPDLRGLPWPTREIRLARTILTTRALWAMRRTDQRKREAAAARGENPADLRTGYDAGQWQPGDPEPTIGDVIEELKRGL